MLSHMYIVSHHYINTGLTILLLKKHNISDWREFKVNIQKCLTIQMPFYVLAVGVQITTEW